MSDLLLMSPPGLPRNGLIALYDPYRDAYGLDATARAALQTGVDYSGRGNSLTYGADTNASTDDPVNTGTAWSFDGGDFLGGTIPSIAANGARSLLIVFKGSTSNAGHVLAVHGAPSTRSSFGLSREITTNKLQVFTFADDLVSDWVLDANVHVACGVYNGARGLSLYYDGNATPATTTLSGDLNVAGATLLLGKLFNSSQYYDSLIYMAAYYNRNFSTGEYLRIQRTLKSIMASRGVTLA